MTRRSAVSGCVFSLLVVALTVVFSTSVAHAQPTTTTLSPNPVSPSVVGQSVAFTATVTPAGATGQVTFLDLGVAIGSAILDVTGHAAFSTAILTSGSHSIVASYGGDGAFFASSSAALPYSVGQRATTLNLGAPSPNPVGVGAVATVTTTVTDAATTGPAGTPGAFATLPATADLKTGRSGQTATLLRDGTVLVTGGTDSTGTILASAELYDPITRTFTLLSTSLNTPRTGHTATLLPDGTVLFVGGITTGNTEVGTAELYNPLTGIFTLLGNSLTTARAGHTATLIGGKVLIAGGTAAGPTLLATVEVYDIAGGTFTVATGNLAVTRSGHAATLLSDGSTILITGGDSAGTAEAITYTSGTNTVNTSGTATWATARSGHTATLLSDGNLLITGGLASGIAVSTVELYEVPASLTPFPTSFVTVAPASGMNTARAGHTAVLQNSGLVLITGGLDATTPTPATLNTGETYTPAFDPLGSVTMGSDDPTDIRANCTLALSGTGATTCNVTDKPTAVGTPPRTLTVTYSGDTNHTAPAAELTTLGVQPGNVTTAVTSSANPSVFGQSVTFTATLTVGGGTPTGTVTFLDSGSPISGAVPLSGNVATFATSALATASHTITADYSGDSNFNLSTGALANNPQVVNAANTSIAAVDQTTTYSASVHNVTLSATVTANTPSTATVNEGTVTFTVGSLPPATPVTVINGSASVSYTIPGGTAAGVYTIQAAYSGGSNFGASTDSSHTLTIVSPPTVTSITPSSGPTAGGTGVTIAGTDFQAGATVTFGGTAATNVAVVSATQITATAPAHAAGTVNVVVTNPDNQSGTLTAAYTYVPPPSPTSISPSSGPTAGGTAVAISGTDFVSGATVTFNGTAATNVVVVSATQITATTPAHAAAAVSVVVTNPDNQTGTLTNGYTYALPPAISEQFSPATTVVGTDTTLSFTIDNPNAGTSLSGIAFTDSLPAGLQVGTNGSSGSCGGGTITAAPGSSTVSLTNATLAPSASCNFSVEVSPTAIGVKTNVTGPVTSTNGGTGSTASANLTVNCAFSINPTQNLSVLADDGSAGTLFSIAVNADSSCTWTAAPTSSGGPNQPWLNIQSGGGGVTGNGTVTYTVTNNLGPLATSSRNGNITFTYMGGPTSLPVTQAVVAITGIQAPTTTSIHVRGGSLSPFQATVTGAHDTSVMWSDACNYTVCQNLSPASPVAGGTAVTFTAPADIAGSAPPYTAGMDTITATAHVDSTKVAATSASIGIINDPPVVPVPVVAIPSQSSAQPSFNVRVSAIPTDSESDIANSTITWETGGQPLTFTGSATNPYNDTGALFQTYTIGITTTDTSGATTTNTASVTFTPSPSNLSSYSMFQGNSVDLALPVDAFNGPAGDIVQLSCPSIIGPTGATQSLASVGVSCTFSGPVTANDIVTLPPTSTIGLKIITTLSATASLRGNTSKSSVLYAAILGMPAFAFFGLMAIPKQRKRKELVAAALLLTEVAVLAVLLLVLPGCGGGFNAQFIQPGAGSTPVGVYYLTVTATDCASASSCPAPTDPNAVVRSNFLVPFTVTAQH